MTASNTTASARATARVPATTANGSGAIANPPTAKTEAMSTFLPDSPFHSSNQRENAKGGHEAAMGQKKRKQEAKDG